MSFNKIIICGHLGKDPELKYTPQGTPVCSFTMATSERRKDKSGDSQEITTWFRVTLWGRQAETAAQYLEKGRSVYIEGRLRVEEWTDRDGKARHTLEVNATDMQFIGGNQAERPASHDVPASQLSGGAIGFSETGPSDDDDGIVF